MGVEVVLYNPDLVSLRIKFNDVFHALRKIEFGSTFSNQHLAKAALGFAYHHQIANSLALVFRIFAGRFSGLGGRRLADFGNQLQRAFVKANNRSLRVVRFCVQVQNIFHRGDKVSADFRDTPLLFLPGFKRVFLKAVVPTHG